MSFLKKGISVFLGAILIFGTAAVSLAETKVSGNLKLMYNFVKDENDENSGDSVISQDGGELKIYFDNKLNDNVNSRITLKGYLDAMSDSDRAKPYNYIDEYYVNANSKYGTFKAGKWGFKPKGKIDVLDTAFGDFKAEQAVQWTYAFENGIKTGLWTVLDRSSLAEVVGDHAYVATLGWAKDKLIDFDVNLVDTGNEADIRKVLKGNKKTNSKADLLNSTYGEGTQTGYNVNLALCMFDPVVRPFFHYGKDDIKGALNDEVWIIGATGKIGAWDLLVEYQLDDDYVKGTTSYKNLDNAYGCKIKYNFKNKMNLEWKYYKYDDGLDKEKNELGLNIPF